MIEDDEKIEMNNQKNIEKTEKEILLTTMKKEYSVSEIVNFYGVNIVHLTLLTLFCGVLFAGEASIVMMLTFLMPEMKKHWNLNNFQEGIIGTVLFVGFFFGSTAYGYLSDRYGRKSALFLAVCNICFFSVAAGFCDNYLIFVTIRLIIGFNMGGCSVAFSYFTEYLPTKYRGYGLLLLELFWSVFSIFESLLGWVCFSFDIPYNWNIFCILTSAPLMISFFIFPFINETLRYLSISGDQKGIMKIIKKMEKHSKKKLEGEYVVKVSKESAKRKGNVLELFTLNWKLTFSFLNICFFMLAGSLVYYGSILSMTDFIDSKSPYLIVLFSSFAEIPGILVPALFISSVGRKKIQGISFILSGIALGFLVFKVSDSMWYEIFVTFIFRGLIMAASSMTWVLTQETLPTNLRSVGSGIACSAAKASNSITPLLTKLFQWHHLLIPKIVFVSFAFLAGISSFLHIETKDIELRDYGNITKEDKNENISEYGNIQEDKNKIIENNFQEDKNDEDDSLL